MQDFLGMIQTKPKEVMGAISLGLTLASMPTFASDNEEPYVVLPRFSGLTPETSIADIRSSTVGQLVALSGHVIKVAPYKCLIVTACYRCVKCYGTTWSYLEDGVLEEPTSCSVKGCRSRTLELLRNNVGTTDCQTIKLQERDIHRDDTDSARVPRTFEVELRGSLIDRCVTGDVVLVHGVVKARSTLAPRWGSGGKKSEAGLHALYVVANSLKTLKASGRDASASTHAASATDTDDAAAGGDATRAGGAKGTSASDVARGVGPDWTARELRMVRAVAAAPACTGLLVQSLCPGIYGQELVKAGLLLSLFGGTPTQAAEISIRSDIHVLIVGDPGMGKSQMLKAAAEVAPRSVYVCGITATTAGLTVSLGREGQRGDLAIEAGALVLSDRGVCCIDELDKMSCDPHALLEAMEQQQISIAKAGVVTKMSSRTAVLAAANPREGHYNCGKSVSENIKTNPALLSRFDLVFLLVDRPDELRDKMISEHILATHRGAAGEENFGGTAKKRRRKGTGFGGSKSESESESNDLLADVGPSGSDAVTMTQRLRKQCEQHMGSEMPHDNLKAYIEYARRYCHPSMTPEAAKVLQKMYLSLRSRASLGDAVPVTTRQLESLIRLAQARARMEMRTAVTEQDARDVVDLLHESLLDAYTSDTGRVDLAGKLKSREKRVKAVLAQLRREADARGGVRDAKFTRSDIRNVMAGLRLDTDTGAVTDLISLMNDQAFLLIKGPGLYGLV